MTIVSDPVFSLAQNVFIPAYSAEKTSPKQLDEALKKVEEAKGANTNSTLAMMDRHNEMVKKSQKLNAARAKQQAIERRNKKRREEHSVLLAEMALQNAERSDRLKQARLKAQDQKSE